ncbi:ankyrin repeat-containing domain protein [Aspergillus germanicus]
MDAADQMQIAYKPENRIGLPEEMVLEITKCLPRSDLARFVRASKQALRFGHPVLYRLSVEEALHTFSWACRAQLGSVVGYLLPGLLDANKDDPKIGYQALIYAAKNGRSEIVRQLLAHKVALDIPEMGLSPLTFAVREDHADVVRPLITVGADLSSIDQNGVFDWDVEMLQIATRERIIHSAVTWKSVKVLRSLQSMSLGLDIDARNAQGQTALCKAAELGHPAVVKALVSLNASLTAACTMGYSPLHYAVNEQHPSVVEVLLLAGADPGVRGPEDNFIPPPLLTTALNSAVKIARILLDYGANPEDTFDWRGRTALSLVAEFKGGSEILDLLLNRGADKNTQCALGITPISYAAACGNIFAARKLLAAGCDLRPDSFGRTAEYFILNNLVLCAIPVAQELLDLLGKARKLRAGVVRSPNFVPPS